MLASSTLVALSKPNMDVRPIAIGEVLARLLQRAACLQLREPMARVFLPSQQFGVGESPPSAQSEDLVRATL
ncbi:hypothetical protein CLOM_g16131 [Closterium sp. NIES-68]|nr:hypothetical protein CLOM_g16131 [Closterium sp. NIES-68]